MKALVLGLGISGKSAVAFLKKRGVEVVAVDDKTAPGDPGEMASYDLFVPSPGIPQTHPLYVKAKELNIPIKGEIQLAFEELKQPAIGVTGTNGKTTLVNMIAHGLNGCQKKARAVGNIGEPLTEYVGKSDEILVIELSSYQLETADRPVLDVGILLNITEDHLDRYESFDKYVKAKVNIEKCMKKGGELYVDRSVSPSLFHFPIKSIDCSVEEIAYLAAAPFGIERNSFFQALSSFEKPAHRIEFVGEFDGIAYYNDSKGTNVGAVLYALKAIKGTILLIAGGLDKGLDFHPINAFKDRLDKVVVFGQAREKIANALKDQVDVHVTETLEEAVFFAKRFAKANTTVLFSPGCASFDAFKNYADRGEAFKRYVRGTT